jgi:kynureninase
MEPGAIYFDGNSLGRPLRSTLEALTDAIQQQWAQGLIRSWDRWRELPLQVGDQLGQSLLGACRGEVVVADSTSVNLYKLARAATAAQPLRRVVVVEEDNFPSDHYVLQGMAAFSDLEVRTFPVDPDEGWHLQDLDKALDEGVALVCLSHVSYRSGALADMKGITRAVHARGGLVLWDLCHSVGVVPIDLTDAGADLAVGCTYKYLNGGPGAPAFLYVRQELQERLRQPIWGWFGQQDQFEMASTYRPVQGIGAFQAGTPSILGALAVAEGVRVVAEAGMPAVREKSVALTSYAVDLAERWLEPLGFRLASPRDPLRRGSHISLHHPHARHLTGVLIEDGVLADYRAPERIRLGLAPLTTSFCDVHDGLRRLGELASEHLRTSEAAT